MDKLNDKENQINWEKKTYEFAWNEKCFRENKLEFFPIFEDTTDKTSSNLNVFKYNMCILII